MPHGAAPGAAGFCHVEAVAPAGGYALGAGGGVGWCHDGGGGAGAVGGAEVGGVHAGAVGGSAVLGPQGPVAGGPDGGGAGGANGEGAGVLGGGGVTCVASWSPGVTTWVASGPAGAGGGGAAAAAIGCPQPVQNEAAAGTSVPQLEHAIVSLTRSAFLDADRAIVPEHDEVG